MTALDRLKRIRRNANGMNIADYEDLQEAINELEDKAGENMGLLLFIGKIREAVGDNGLRMQDEFLEYLRGLGKSVDTRSDLTISELLRP